MNDIYGTVDLAKMLGCPEPTLRSHKARRPDLLQERKHWIKDGSATLWTHAGAVVLAHLVNTPESQAWLQRNATQPATPPDATVQRNGTQHRNVATPNGAATQRDAMQQPQPQSQGGGLQRIADQAMGQIDRAFDQVEAAIADHMANRYQDLQANVMRRFDQRRQDLAEPSFEFSFGGLPAAPEQTALPPVEEVELEAVEAEQVGDAHYVTYDPSQDEEPVLQHYISDDDD